MKTQEDLLKEMVGKHPKATPKRMPITKIEAFEKQFGWIRDYIKGPIAQVYVSGVEAELIGHRLSFIESYHIVYDWDGADKVSDFLDEKVFLLDDNFKLVTSERPETYWVKKHRFFGPKVPRQRIIHFDGSTTFTIKSALEELGEKGALVRILLSYFEYTQAVIIYKLPKDVSLKDFVDHETEAERASFKKTFEEI